MTMTSELTPFFPPHIKPVRPGVYLVRRGWHVYSKWDGHWWWGTRFLIADAAKAPLICGEQELTWCGLAYDPAEKMRGELDA